MQSFIEASYCSGKRGLSFVRFKFRDQFESRKIYCSRGSRRKNSDILFLNVLVQVFIFVTLLFSPFAIKKACCQREKNRIFLSAHVFVHRESTIVQSLCTFQTGRYKSGQESLFGDLERDWQGGKNGGGIFPRESFFPRLFLSCPYTFSLFRATN